MAGRIRIREVTGPDDPAFAGAYAVLRRTFPPAELVPRAEMRYTLQERAAGVWTDLRWHLIAAVRGDEVVGAASGTYIGSLNVALVGYLAVEPAVRSRGLGPRLRRRLLEAFDRDARALVGRRLGAVIGEVEADNPWLRYLVRHRGALALDVPYLQPAVRSDEGMVALILYWEPVGRRPVTRLPATEVRKLLYAIWRRGYRVARPLADRRFRAMLASLDGRRSIGARRLPPARPTLRPHE